jgi:hypothetical protein
MEKLLSGDKVILKRNIFAKHKHLRHTGEIVENPGVGAFVGTIFVRWDDESFEWVYASWLERV